MAAPDSRLAGTTDEGVLTAPDLSPCIQETPVTLWRPSLDEQGAEEAADREVAAAATAASKRRVSIAWQGGEDSPSSEDSRPRSPPNEAQPPSLRPSPDGSAEPFDPCEQHGAMPGACSSANSSMALRPGRSSDLGKSFSNAASFVGRSLKDAVLGDDLTVRDKWDNYDDELEDSFAELRKASMSISRAVGGKVRPSPPSKGAIRRESSSGSGALAPSLSTVSATPFVDILHEKRATRTLLWNYLQMCCFSVLVAAVCIPLVTALSAIHWSIPVDSAANTTDISGGDPDSVNGTATGAAFAPNRKALQLMMLFQIMFPLVLYSVSMHICIKRSFHVPRVLVFTAAGTVAWALLATMLMYRYDFSFWFYYVDLFLIVIAYVPCMCVVAWHLEDEAATVRARLMDVLFASALETIVAAATLVYCLFLMPFFFTLTNAWYQMAWLCVLHPLYFEATTGFVVRKTLQRNRELGRNHIVYFLTIVHSMVHTVALATSLQASIEPIRILSITILFYNLSKLFWRSTVIQRDLLVERLFRWSWSFTYPEEELVELARMVSVGVITEIILENASILITPYMMFRMYQEPIFMSVVPNTFFNNGGTYPVKTLFSLIALLLLFTITFDLIFYFVNYHTLQRLPIINTWRRIKRCQGWYLLFLVYAFASMGVLFLFLMMMILPRAAFCKSDNYCDCSLLSYQAICHHQYISMLVDYLVTPYQ